MPLDEEKKVWELDYTEQTNQPSLIDESSSSSERYPFYKEDQVISGIEKTRSDLRQNFQVGPINLSNELASIKASNNLYLRTQKPTDLSGYSNSYLLIDNSANGIEPRWQLFYVTETEKNLLEIPLDTIPHLTEELANKNSLADIDKTVMTDLINQVADNQNQLGMNLLIYTLADQVANLYSSTERDEKRRAILTELQQPTNDISSEAQFIRHILANLHQHAFLGKAAFQFYSDANEKKFKISGSKPQISIQIDLSGKPNDIHNPLEARLTISNDFKDGVTFLRTEAVQEEESYSVEKSIEKAKYSLLKICDTELSEIKEILATEKTKIITGEELQALQEEQSDASNLKLLEAKSNLAELLVTETTILLKNLEKIESVANGTILLYQCDAEKINRDSAKKIAKQRGINLKEAGHFWQEAPFKELGGHENADDRFMLCEHIKTLKHDLYQQLKVREINARIAYLTYKQKSDEIKNINQDAYEERKIVINELNSQLETEQLEKKGLSSLKIEATYQLQQQQNEVTKNLLQSKLVVSDALLKNNIDVFPDDKSEGVQKIREEKRNIEEIRKISKNSKPDIEEFIRQINQIDFRLLTTTEQRFIIDKFKLALTQKINDYSVLSDSYNLSVLKFNHCEVLTDKDLKFILEKIHKIPPVTNQLTTLEINGCPLLTKMKMKLPNLENLSIEGCNQLSLMRVKAPKLETFTAQKLPALNRIEIKSEKEISPQNVLIKECAALNRVRFIDDNNTFKHGNRPQYAFYNQRSSLRKAKAAFLALIKAQSNLVIDDISVVYALKNLATKIEKEDPRTFNTIIKVLMNNVNNEKVGIYCADALEKYITTKPELYKPENILVLPSEFPIDQLKQGLSKFGLEHNTHIEAIDIRSIHLESDAIFNLIRNLARPIALIITPEQSSILRMWPTHGQQAELTTTARMAGMMGSTLEEHPDTNSDLKNTSDEHLTDDDDDDDDELAHIEPLSTTASTLADEVVHSPTAQTSTSPRSVTTSGISSTPESEPGPSSPSFRT